MTSPNFHVLENPVLSPDDLAYLTSVATRSLRPTGPSKRHFNQHARKFFMRDPRAFRTMLSVLEVPAVAQIVRARAEKPYLDELDLLVKEANGPETTWHQDRPYWPWDQPASMFTIWVTLGDVDQVNGCLRVGANPMREVLPHKQVKYGTQNEFSVLAIDPAQFDLGTIDVKNLPLRAGSAVIFDSFTIHGAFPNQSDEPRISFKLVLGDLARRKARGGGRVMRLHNFEHALNRRLGFLPAYAAMNVRTTVISEARQVLRAISSKRAAS